MKQRLFGGPANKSASALYWLAIVTSFPNNTRISTRLAGIQHIE